MKNKEVFELPKAEVVLFENEDVITTSSEGPLVPAGLDYYAQQDDEQES